MHYQVPATFLADLLEPIASRKTSKRGRLFVQDFILQPFSCADIGG